MNKLFNIITLLFLVFLFSCTKEVYVEIPDNNPKLVINSYLTPNIDTIKVWVSKSTPLYHVYDENNQMVSNALVEISNNQSTWTTIPFDVNTNSYLIFTSEFPIIENQKYYIRVSAPNFETVESSLTIPIFENINFRYIKYENRLSEWGDTSRLITYKFNDPSGKNNFYAFNAIVRRYEPENQYSYTSELYVDNGSWVMTDKNRDGKEISITFNGWDVHTGDTVQISVMQTDEAFYLFHSSLDNYGGDNPFTEATPIYSNIKNGLGVFAGYTSQKYFFVIP